MARVKYENGESYIGEYKYDKRHGKGQYTFNNKEVYSGGFVNNLKHGIGYIIKDGETITSGTWVEDDYVGNKELLHHSNT